MADYQWNIDKVETIRFFGGQYDVVSKVDWHMTATAGTLKTDYYGSTVIPTDDLTHFVPYGYLTNDQISHWLEEIIDMQWLHNLLDYQLQKMQQPSATTISR